MRSLDQNANITVKQGIRSRVAGSGCNAASLTAEMRDRFEFSRPSTGRSLAKTLAPHAATIL
jgi:phosphoheptose isomerase